MTVKEIQKALNRLYANHMYHLYNSYIYEWESDYFSQSRSGYDYEVEIKLSRSDFLADFKKKGKHDILSKTFNKENFVVQQVGTYSGQLISDYEVGYIKKRYMPMSGVPIHYTEYTHEDELNGFKDFYLYKQRIKIYARGTRLSIREISKINRPNRFYYACPVGLINIQDLPPYAGLIWVNSDGIASEEKRAPILHKDSCDLKQILLDKFYYETARHRIGAEWRDNEEQNKKQIL